jgi:DNA primase
MSLAEFILECHNNLVKGTIRECDNAKEYLTKRNLTEASINTHKIGYCSIAKSLPESVRFFGQDLSEEDKKWDMSYFIRGRIIVPIYSEFNKPVGFATRIPSTLPGNTWWNVPFKKSNHIFLMNVIRKEVFKQNKIYLVEGYMDAIILHQQGLKNVGCIMGTALPSRKIGLVARYCNNVCLCFDSDKNEAGQNAQKMAIVTLKKFDFCETISVIDSLPVGEDPDVYIMKNGLDAFISQERVLKTNEIKKICKEVATKGKGVENAQ